MFSVCTQSSCLFSVLVTLNVLKEAKWQNNCEGAVTHLRARGVPSALSPGEMQGPGRFVCWWQAHEENMQSYKKLQQARGTFILRNQGKEYFPALPSLWLFRTFELTREPWFGIHNMWEECSKFFSFWFFFPLFEAFFLCQGIVQSAETQLRPGKAVLMPLAGVSSSWRMGRGWTACWENRFFRQSPVGRAVG